jgi:hypothetical protein
MAQITSETIYNALGNIKKPIFNDSIIGGKVTKDKLGKFGLSLLDGEPNVYGKHQRDSCGPPDLIACNSTNINEWKNLYERALTCLNRRIQSDADFISKYKQQPNDGHRMALQRAYYVSSSCSGLLTKYASESIQNIEKDISKELTIPTNFYYLVRARLDQAQFSAGNRDQITGVNPYEVIPEDTVIKQAVIQDIKIKAVQQKSISEFPELPRASAPKAASPKAAPKAASPKAASPKAVVAVEKSKRETPYKSGFMHILHKLSSPPSNVKSTVGLSKHLLKKFFGKKKGGYKKQTKKNRRNSRRARH